MHNILQFAESPQTNAPGSAEASFHASEAGGKSAGAGGVDVGGGGGGGGVDVGGDAWWTGMPGAESRRAGDGTPPPLPENLPAPGPCPSCGGGNFWVDASPAAEVRCEVCQPSPASVLVARRLFVLMWTRSHGGTPERPVYEWIDFAWETRGH